MQDESITEADRIAVISLFKEIAEFGRRVRQRRAGEIEVTSMETSPSDEVRPVEGEAPESA